MLQAVRVGFKDQELAVLEIVDSFGQRSVMTFTGLRVNTALEAATFQFKPPAGADLIQQ
jgi:outer membrane lipoprotein carrier protein